MSHPVLFKWKHFQPEIILLNVRWYCRYALSYRDLEEMMAERGLSVDHSTINRWVLQYAPELDKRCRPYRFCRKNNEMIQLNFYFLDVICRSFQVHVSSILIQVEALST